MKLLCALILVLLDRVPYQRVSSVCSVQKVVRRPNWLRESPILDKKFQIANNKRNSNGKIGKILVDRVSEELKSWPAQCVSYKTLFRAAQSSICASTGRYRCPPGVHRLEEQGANVFQLLMPRGPPVSSSIPSYLCRSRRNLRAS